MYTASVLIFKRLFVVVILVLLAACGGGGGGGPSTEQSLSQPAAEQSPPQPAPAFQPQLFIAGAGIKGPLAFASVELYKLDTRFSRLYHPGKPIAAATTNAYAEITGLAVPVDTAPPYILIIDGTNAIDRNTGIAPVIGKLVTIITQKSLDSMKPVYATPYTTLAYQMLRNVSGTSINKTSSAIEDDLDQFNQDIIQAIGFGMPAETDIFTTPPIITADATSIEKQQLVVNYRAAIEALSSLLYKMSLSSKPFITTDSLLKRLALDLYSDGVIDDSASGQSIGRIDTAILSGNPMLQTIPNTGYLVRDVITMMDEERSLVGGSSNVEFLKNDIAVALVPALLDSRIDSTQLSGYTEPVGSTANTLLLAGLIASPPVGGEVLFSHDFNSDSLGTYTVADLKASWDTNNAGVSMKDYNTVEIVKDPDNGARGNVMSVFFNAGGVGYQRFVCCNGAQWKTPVGPKDELYLSYDVMFEPGFEFALGGKLPGLFGGEFIGGGNVPTGYEGWSGRMMWKKGGTIVQYMYHAGMPDKYGQNFKWKNASGEQTRFIPGKWHTVEIRYVINTPGIADGIVQGWFDGKLALDTGKKFLFRKTDAFSINGLIVTTFFGGATAKWASPKDQHVLFDNFVVSTKPITH